MLVILSDQRVIGIDPRQSEIPRLCLKSVGDIQAQLRNIPPSGQSVYPNIAGPVRDIGIMHFVSEVDERVGRWIEEKVGFVVGVNVTDRAVERQIIGGHGRQLQFKTSEACFASVDRLGSSSGRARHELADLEIAVIRVIGREIGSQPSLQKVRLQADFIRFDAFRIENFGIARSARVEPA